MHISPLFIILYWHFDTYKKYDLKVCFCIVAYSVSITLAEQTSTIHEKLIKVNKEGAYRFAIYIALITMCYDWNGNAETQEYIRETTKLELIDEYIGKLRECIH